MTNGPSILTIVGGDAWHHRRKGIHPAFAPKSIQRMNAVALELANEWIQTTVLPLSDGSGSFNVGEHMLELTVGIICKAAFAYDVSVEESREILIAIRQG